MQPGAGGMMAPHQVERRPAEPSLGGLRWLFIGGVLLLILLLTGTQAAAQDQPPERAYLPQIQAARPEGYRLYLPMWQRAPKVLRLGLAGGTPEQVRVLGGDWLYDWSATPQGSDQVEAVPMIWGRSQVGQALGGNSDWLLLFNEPDLCPWQACLSPAEAVAPYLRIVALYPQVRQVSPAPSSEDIRRMHAPGSTYRGWLPLFREAVFEATGRYPEFQALAMHCYEWTAEACIAVGRQFVEWADAWGVAEIWISEVTFVEKWAADAEAEARAFMAWAQAEPKVARVALFTAHAERGSWYWPDEDMEADPSLFVEPESLELTEMGRWYVPLHLDR